jgi:hypothetical protein
MFLSRYFFFHFFFRFFPQVGEEGGGRAIIFVNAIGEARRWAILFVLFSFFFFECGRRSAAVGDSAQTSAALLRAHVLMCTLIAG